jgi:DNA-directed RNA polymerase specialized sigma24 family protein
MTQTQTPSSQSTKQQPIAPVDPTATSLMEYMQDSLLDPLDKLALEEAINTLTEEQREIVIRWTWHGQKFDEIGVDVGMKYRGRVLTGSTVRYHKNRAMRLLRVALGTDTPEDDEDDVLPDEV